MFDERASLVMVGFGVEYVWLGDVVVVFTHVLKTAWRAVVSVADDGVVLYYESTYLPTSAVGVLGPYPCHAQIAQVKVSLFVA